MSSSLSSSSLPADARLPDLSVPDLAAWLEALPLGDLVLFADRMLTRVAVAKIVLLHRDPELHERWIAALADRAFALMHEADTLIAPGEVPS